MTRRIVLALLLLAMALPLADCGRKGDVRPPPGEEQSDFPRRYPSL
jgi:predicted small lipoprotein YifL